MAFFWFLNLRSWACVIGVTCGWVILVWVYFPADGDAAVEALGASIPESQLLIPRPVNLRSRVHDAHTPLVVTARKASDVRTNVHRHNVGVFHRRSVAFPPDDGLLLAYLPSTFALPTMPILRLTHHLDCVEMRIDAPVGFDFGLGRHHSPTMGALGRYFKAQCFASHARL
jgi:hypothetical protein